MSTSGNTRYLVTGGASGIGAAVARLLAARGGIVTVLDIQSPADNNDKSICHVRGSVADEQAVETAVKTAAGDDGRLDGLVNNAGLLRNHPVEDMAFEDWRAMLDINVGGYFLTAKHAFGRMKTHGGAIVNCASIMAYNSAPGAAAYSASKSAVLGLTRATALEGAPFNIRCNAVCPGTIDTPLYRRYLAEKADPQAEHARMGKLYPLGRIGTGRDVAGLVAFLLSDEASWITGQDFVIDGGYLAKGTNE